MIAYDLTQGLNLQKETFGPGSTSLSHWLPGSMFAPLEAGDPIIAETYAAARRPIPREIYGGRALTVMSMRDSSPDALLFGMDWGADFEHPIGEASIACVAKQMPNSRVVSWNAFGQGSLHPSGRIERAAIKHASQTGTFDEVGRAYAKRLAPLLARHEHIDLFGSSEGGRIVLSMARHLKRIRNVILFDAPGTLGDDSSFYDYAVNRFFVEEGKHSDAYAEFSQDVQMKTFLAEEDKNLKKIGIRVAKHIGRGVFIDHYVRSPNGMRKDGLGGDMKLAAPYISGKLGFLLPTQTRVNNADQVREDMDATTDYFAGTELALWSLPGTHAIMNAGNMVQASLLAYAAKH